MSIRRTAKEYKINKNLEAREAIFPNTDPKRLWHGKKNTGYAQIPRTMPIILSIIRELGEKGKNSKLTYLSLWFRCFESGFLEINNPRDLAFESGFDSQRGESTWKIRMEKLLELGFIDAKEGSAGKFNFVLLYDPHVIIEELVEKGKISKENKSYRILKKRMIDYGVNSRDNTVDEANSIEF